MKLAGFFSDNFIENLTKVLIILIIIGGLAFGAYYYSFSRQRSKESTRFEAVTPYLEAQVRKDPRNVSLRVQLGEAYIKEEKYNDAIDQFKQALKLDEQNQAAIIGIGIAYVQLEKYEEAYKQFQKEIRLAEGTDFEQQNQQLEQAYFYTAFVLFEWDRLDEAIEFSQKALRINRTKSDTFFMLGRINLEKKDYEQALVNFRKAIRYDPTFADAYYGIGLSEEKLGDKKQAIIAYEKAIEIDPKFEQAKTQLEKIKD